MQRPRPCGSPGSASALCAAESVKTRLFRSSSDGGHVYLTIQTYGARPGWSSATHPRKRRGGTKYETSTRSPRRADNFEIYVSGLYAATHWLRSPVPHASLPSIRRWSQCKSALGNVQHSERLGAGGRGFPTSQHNFRHLRALSVRAFLVATGQLTFKKEGGPRLWTGPLVNSKSYVLLGSFQ